MSKTAIQRSIKTLFSCSLILCAPLLAEPEKTVTPDTCSKDFLHSFFPEQLVNQTLQKFNIPQTQWADINKGLAEKDKQVLTIVAERAAKINPNPLRNPQDRQAGLKLFRDTLQEIFTTVIKNNGIADEPQIQAMFEDLRERNAKNFSQCQKVK